MHTTFQIVPYMFDNVDIRTVRRPVKFVDLLLLEPCSSELRSMLRVIVLLEIYVLLVDSKVAKGPYELVVKDLDV